MPDKRDSSNSSSKYREPSRDSLEDRGRNVPPPPPVLKTQGSEDGKPSGGGQDSQSSPQQSESGSKSN